MSEPHSIEHHYFSRIPFQANVHIKTDKGELHLNCDVIDMYFD